MLQSLVYISWLAMVVYFLNFAKQQIFLSSLIGLARYTCARVVAASLVSSWSAGFMYTWEVHAYNYI